MPFIESTSEQLLLIIDLPYRNNGKASVVRLDQERLRLIVRDTADPKIAFHLLHIPLKLCPERRILYIMDRAAEFTVAVCGHSASSRPQMGMVIHPVKKLQYAVFLRCNSKKSAH